MFDTEDTNDDRELPGGRSEVVDRLAATRRTFLKSTAAAGAAAGLTGSATAQATAQTFELDGFTSGWVGESPEEIEGEENPTLELEVGETYVVEWTNADGVPHDFVLLDADGERIEGTEIFGEQGETHRLEFEATEEMAQYYCSVHPAEMRGEIDLVDVEDAPEIEEELLIEPGPTVGLQTVAEGLDSPVDLDQADEEADRRFIVDQPGRIYVHGPDGLEDEPFLDISDRVSIETESFDERGLLGLAFHPDFEENGRFFVRYSGHRGTVTPANWSHTFVLSEFHADENGATADPDSEERLLEVPQPQFNHNAGPIEFGPDGYLYVAVGDGGNADDVGPGHLDDWYDENEGGNGQNTRDTLLGGMLRIDVDDEEGGKPYAIPDDNPFYAPETDDGETDTGEDIEFDPEEGMAEYYAWGMRNPWGMSFTDDGELLAADVGQLLFEIVNHVERGRNYGWNVKEGTHCFDTDNPGQPPEDCPESTPDDVRGGEEFVDPIIEYPQEYDVQNLGSAIVGGDIYTGDELSEIRGSYVFGDWSELFTDPLGKLFVAHPPEGWPDDPDAMPEESFADQAGDQPLYQEEERWDELWPIEELRVEAADELLRTANGEMQDDEQEADRLARFVLAIEPDEDGNLYVLTSAENYPADGTGMVHQLVAPDAIDEETPEADDDEEYDFADQPDDASVVFDSPADGDTVQSPVELQASVEGIDLEPAGTMEAGTGHLHVLVDRDCFEEGEYIPGPSESAEEDGIFHWSDGQSEDSLELEPGEYTLCMQIGDGAHRAFGQTDEITISVEE